jgi:hypothetical protein
MLSRPFAWWPSIRVGVLPRIKVCNLHFSSLRVQGSCAVPLELASARHGGRVLESSCHYIAPQHMPPSQQPAGADLTLFNDACLHVPTGRAARKSYLLIISQGHEHILQFWWTSLRMLRGKGGRRAAAGTSHLASVVAAAATAGAFGAQDSGPAASGSKSGDGGGGGGGGGGSTGSGGGSGSFRSIMRALSSANRGAHGAMPPVSPFAAASTEGGDGGEAGGGAGRNLAGPASRCCK